VITHGGYGYAKEYYVERYLREAMLPRIAPVTTLSLTVGTTF
jgi:alkylation response protein AidB-like acyl-CoA dehydrogenase